VPGRICSRRLGGQRSWTAARTAAAAAPTRCIRNIFDIIAFNKDMFLTRGDGGHVAAVCARACRFIDP